MARPRGTPNAVGRGGPTLPSPNVDAVKQSTLPITSTAFSLTRVSASDLARARDTAAILAAGLGIDADVVCEPDLRERHVGAFEGKTIEELLTVYPNAFETGTNRLLAIPDGESDSDLLARTRPALVALAHQFADDRLLVISHGGVIRAIERSLGVEPGPATPNLGGRWLLVGDDGLTAGDRFVPLEAELVTRPPTE